MGDGVVGMVNGEPIELDPYTKLRLRLAKALGLTSPTDDELVARAEEAARRAESWAAHGDPLRDSTIKTQAFLIDLLQRLPTLTDAPLPEGREGESIVVAYMTGRTGASEVARWCECVWMGPDFEARPGADGYRWAYIRRIE